MEIDNKIPVEVQICRGCLPIGVEFELNLDPTFLTSPNTPVNFFVHQSLIKTIHVCKAIVPRQANVWKTTKLLISVELVNALKATRGIEAGPVTTDPDWRYARDEPVEQTPLDAPTG